MRNLNIKIYPVILLAVLSAGCRKNITQAEKQSMLFEFEHISYDMEYQHSGFIIDSDGNVFTYHNPESWNFPDKDLMISAQQVEQNLAMCKRSRIRVTEQELGKYSAHIKNIAASKVTALRNVSDNSGSGEYICYLYNGNTGYYKGTIIKMEGDFTCENLNFYSRKVYDWMREINWKLGGK